MSAREAEGPAREEAQAHRQTVSRPRNADQSRPSTAGSGLFAPSKDARSQLGSSTPSTPQTPSRTPENMRRGRLEQLLGHERRKESLLARLKVKFVKPNMEPALKEAMERAVDEMGALPSISMAELEMLQKRVQRIEHDFRRKVHGTISSRPGTSYSRSLSTPKSIEQSRPQSSWSTAEYYTHVNPDDAADVWVMGSYADTNAHMAEIMNERSRIILQKNLMNSRLTEMSKEKYDNMRRQHNHEEEEAAKYTTTGDISLIDEDLENINNLIKKRQDNAARINEMVYKVKSRATERSSERDEQEELAESIKDDLNRARRIHQLEADKRHADLLQGLASNEEKFRVKKELIVRGMMEDQDMLEKLAENYDRNLNEREYVDRYAKEWRFARATAVTEPYIKSANEKSHEDEVRAQKERRVHEGRLKQEELRRIQKILRDREDTRLSVEHILKTKEERRRQQINLCDQQAEYWRQEAEHAQNIESTKRSQYTDANRENSRQLMGQSLRGDVIGRRSEPSRHQPQSEVTFSTPGREQRTSYRASSAGPIRPGLAHY